MDYVTIEELEVVYKTLTDAETEKAEALISEASSKIRLKAKACGKDFDALFNADEDLKAVTKGLVCKVVINAMNVPADQIPMTQYSMSAGGYSWSGSPSNPLGGIKFTKADYKSIGLGVQHYGGLDVYGN